MAQPALTSDRVGVTATARLRVTAGATVPGGPVTEPRRPHCGSPTVTVTVTATVRPQEGRLVVASGMPAGTGMLARLTDRHSVTAQGPAADSSTVHRTRNVTVRDGPTFNLKFKLASAAPVRAGHGVAAARLTLRHGPRSRPTVAAVRVHP